MLILALLLVLLLVLLLALALLVLLLAKGSKKMFFEVLRVDLGGSAISLHISIAKG